MCAITGNPLVGETSKSLVSESPKPPTRYSSEVKSYFEQQDLTKENEWLRAARTPKRLLSRDSMHREEGVSSSDELQPDKMAREELKKKHRGQLKDKENARKKQS